MSIEVVRLARVGFLLVGSIVATALVPAVGEAQVQPAAGRTVAPAIPLPWGLTIVTAITQRDVDYESIKTIESISGDLVIARFEVWRKGSKF